MRKGTCRTLRGIHKSDCYSAPAAGYRNDVTGALGGVGIEGDWWSSSVLTSDHCHGGRLYVIAGTFAPLTGWHRAFGFSVRCVQHLPKLLFLKPRSWRGVAPSIRRRLLFGGRTFLLRQKFGRKSSCGPGVDKSVESLLIKVDMCR